MRINLLDVVKRYRVLGLAITFASLSAVYAALHWMNLLKWIEEHPGLAAWVQAIFSVIAILAAIWTAERGAREARRKAEDERLDRFDAVAGAAIHARMVVESALESVAQPSSMFGGFSDGKQVSLASIHDAQRALAEMPVLSIPGGAKVIGDVMAIRRLLAEASTALQDLTAHESTLHQRLSKLQARAAQRAAAIHNAASLARERR